MRTFLEQQVIGSGTFNGDSLARAINHFYKIRAKSPYRCSIPADFFTESRRPLSSLRISICPESKLLDFTWPSYAVTSSLRLEFEKDLPKPAPTKFNPPPASIERPHSPKSQLPKDTTTKYPTWWHVEPQPSCPSLLTRSELSLVSSVSSEDVYDPNFFDRRKGDSTQAEMSHVSPPTARPGRTPWPVHEDWQLDVSHESFPWGEEDEEINDVPFGNPINIELVTDAEGLADSEETDIEECKGFMRRGRRKRMRHVLSSTTLEYSSTVSDLVKNQRRLWT